MLEASVYSCFRLLRSVDAICTTIVAELLEVGKLALVSVKVIGMLAPVRLAAFWSVI